MAVQRIGEKLVKVQIYLELEDIKNIKKIAEKNKITFSAQARKFIEKYIKSQVKKEKEKSKKEQTNNNLVSDFSNLPNFDKGE